MAIAYFSTWTTYGTWLPGDDRGWYHRNYLQPPNLQVQLYAALRQTEDAITLSPDQRQLVEKTIMEHCRIRGWPLHAHNCRTNHIHAIVTASDRPLELPREQFKSWCTRKLNEYAHKQQQSPRQNWWSERGWDTYLDDTHSLTAAIHYVRNQ